MKLNRILISIAAAFIFIGTHAQAADTDCTTLLKDRKWTRYTFSSPSTGNLQGAAFLPAAKNGIDGKDRIYIFKQRPASGDLPYGNSYDYYEPATDSWHQGRNLFDFAPQTHMGSASFGPEVISSYTVGGTTYHCTIPFVYVSGHAYLDAEGNIVDKSTAGAARHITCVALDLENERIVKVFSFPERADDCIIGYDFAGGRIWVIGYTLNTSIGISPYVIDEYRRIDMTDFLSANPTRWDYSSDSSIQPQTVELAPGGGTSSSYTIPSDGSPYCLRMQGGGPDADGIQRTLECGTVQDVFYHDNHLYIVTGRGSLYNRTEHVKIHCYYVAENQHDYDKTIVAPLHGESQGLVFDGTNIWMTLSGGNLGETGIYKYSPRNGDTSYDNLNFQEAQEVSPKTDPATYSITNGYELAWYLDQVYAGRTTINAVLANDIDMTGITLPTTYYIYDKTHKFESQYPFRGTFDGNHKTISNLSIGKTPFNNDGLFPWIVDATIKDFTVDGNITLTKADSNNSGTDVSNVGLIGTAEGNCTITGINLAEFGISNPSSLTTANVNYLIGNDQSTGGDRTTGNILPSDHTNGHIYNADGVCVATGDCDALYQPAALVSGVYQIKNAGNLIWFANAVNGSSAESSNAILVNDIDMKGSKYGEFIGINNYTGTFDGNGKTIRNFSMDKTDGSARTGMFKVASGSAVIKNFTIEGKRNIGGSQNMHGAVVGSLQGSAVIQDVISNVNLTSTSNLAILGGVVGAVESTSAVINRCTYSGTITVGSTIKEIGGVVGNLRGGKVTNCLFDGTIISDTGSSELNFGGIAGSTSTNAGSKIENCLVNGTFNVTNLNSDKCGVVFGYAATSLSFTNVYYVEVSGILAVGDSTVTDNQVKKVEAAWNEICDELDGDGNWEIKAEKAYPVPSKHTPKPHEHNYAANNGYCTNKGCDARRQPVEKNSEGYYEIANAGQFYSWVAKVNEDGEYSAKARLTADIDIDPLKITAVNETFSGIGANSTGKYYTGTFDGQGHTIKGVTHSNTGVTGAGFFNATASSAVLKDFTLEGEMTFNGLTNQYGAGSVVGLPKNTTIEGVTSKVKMTFVNCSSGARIYGGITGRADNCTINKVRYSGTMDLTASPVFADRIAGICGDTNSSSITNTLFDGKILVSATSGTIMVGGILARNNSGTTTIKNCLSVGSITLSAVNSNCGMIVGASGAVVSNSIYTTDGLTVNGVAATGYNATGTKKADTWWNVLSALNTFDGAQTNNWHQELYPVPGAGDPGLVVLNDSGDSMPSLTDVTRIIYSRDASYMHGYISVCLPFDLNASMLPDADCKFMIYKGTKLEDGIVSVMLEEVFSVAPGVPCFIKLSADAEGKDWNIDIEVSDKLVSSPVNPGGSEGMFGALNTLSTGAGYYKLNADGTALLKTTGGSHCYPYRAYIKAGSVATKAGSDTAMIE